MAREMEILDFFAFDVRNVASGVVTRVLTVEKAAELTGDDVIDLGAALEWYSVVCVPDSFAPRFEVSRVPVEGRPS